MAKKSWLERNKKKADTVKKYAALRAELKAKKDYAGLSKLPKNASPVRVVNRCGITGVECLMQRGASLGERRSEEIDEPPCSLRAEQLSMLVDEHRIEMQRGESGRCRVVAHTVTLDGDRDLPPTGPASARPTRRADG